MLTRASANMPRGDYFPTAGDVTLPLLCPSSSRSLASILPFITEWLRVNIFACARWNSGLSMAAWQDSQPKDFSSTERTRSLIDENNHYIITLVHHIRLDEYVLLCQESIYILLNDLHKPTIHATTSGFGCKRLIKWFNVNVVAVLSETLMKQTS